MKKIVSLYVSFYVVMIYMSESQNLHLYIFWGVRISKQEPHTIFVGNNQWGALSDSVVLFDAPKSLKCMIQPTQNILKHPKTTSFTVFHPSPETLPRHEPPVIPVVEPSMDPSVDATADLAMTEMEHFGIGAVQGNFS